MMPKRRVWLWRVAADIVHRLREHDLMMMAAAIAFYWLLGLSRFCSWERRPWATCLDPLTMPQMK